MYYRNKKMGIYWEPKEHAAKALDAGRVISDAILTLLSCGMFYWSAILCLCSLLSLDSGRLSHTFWHGMLLLLPLLLIVRIGCELIPRWRGRIRLSVSALYLAGTVVWLWGHSSEIAYGSASIASQYAKLINYYYKTNLVFSGTAADELWKLPVAGYLVLSLFLILAVLVCLTGRRILMGFLPLLFLCLLMLVGHAPDFAAAAFGFAGVVLSAGRSWDRFESVDGIPQEKRQVWLAEILSVLLLIALAGLIPLGCRAVFGGHAKSLVGSAASLKELQKSIENQIQSYTVSFSSENYETVNNRTPRYKEKEVLRFTVAEGIADTWFEAIKEDDLFWDQVFYYFKQLDPSEMEYDADGSLARTKENADRIFDAYLREYSSQYETGSVTGADYYLRGFYGTDYVDGRWTDDGESFSVECAEAGYEEQDISALVAQTGKQAFVTFDPSDGYECQYLDQTIEYTGLRTRTAYLPYHLVYGKDADLPEFTGDTKLEKSPSEDTLSYSSWYCPMGGFELLGYAWGDYSAAGIWPELSYSYDYLCGGSSDQYDLEPSKRMLWYNRYVRGHFLNVPQERIPSIARIAEERIRLESLDSKLSHSYTDQLIEKEQAGVGSADGENGAGGSVFDGDDEDVDVDWESMLSSVSEPVSDDIQVNAVRLAYAARVSQYLDEMYYSLELDRIADGTDPVEYFLSKSQEGYCVHFASAGVLLLRYLGVPARFASGYIVRDSRFRHNGDGSSTAGVLDSDAHAWAEIYLDNVGWVPYEMTPVARSEEELAAHRQERRDRQGTGTGTGQNAAGSEQASSQQSGGSQSSESGSERTSQNTEQRESASENGAGGTRNPSGSGNADSSPGSGGKGIVSVDLTRALRWVFGAIVCGGVLSVTGVILYRRRRSRELMEELRLRQNRSAVRRINRRIYRRLCRRKHIFRRTLTDREYGGMLRETYSQIEEEPWKDYMDIVKKASFSEGEITPEETALCHRIYQIVMGRGALFK